MNILLLLLVSLAILYLGYRFYARFIEKVFNVDGSHVTPASEVNDGVDYVPTRKFVIFGHHFASIAGGGPIIGPTVALAFGYLPVWLWIIFGALLIGAVHDFSALLTSMREKGRSIAEIAEKTLGRSGFLLLMGFTIIMLVMLTSVFLTLTSTALASKYPISYFGNGNIPIQIIVENGISYAVIGGIASTSVIFITLMAPVVGYLLYVKKVSTLFVSVLALSVCALSVELGIYFPLKIDPLIWMIILSIYTLIATGVPVWAVLQPRDFTNAFLLYAGIAGMVIGSIIVGLNGGVMNAPAENISYGDTHLGLIWPILFITVACGAISGFHALVSGGTTAKQIEKEKPDAKTVGYGGMLLEALLAVGVVIAVGYGIDYNQYSAIVFPTDPALKSNPILAFALGIGGLLYKSMGLQLVYGTVFGILMVEGFVITTLDTAVRLCRYLFEELWSVAFKKVPAFFNSSVFNSSLCVVLMFVLAYYNVFKQLWQLFGSANQLLAALTLLTVSIWLKKHGKKYLFALIPGLFMLITTVVALVIILIQEYIPKKSIVLTIGDIILLCLAVGVMWLCAKVFREKKEITA